MTTKTKLNRKPQLTEAPAQPLSLLARADLTINGQRQQDYGDKLTNFTQIAMLITGTLVRKLAPDQVITAEDVALIMMQVKIARLAHMPNHKDSILDIAGYAGCMDKLQEEREQLTDDNIESLLDTVIRG